MSIEQPQHGGSNLRGNGPLRLGQRKASPALDRVRQEAAICMQCGTCTGSCVVARWMDYGPRGIFALLEAHQDEVVLTSETIWTCASCYSCAARCPRDIPITHLMAELRQEAIKRGYTGGAFRRDTTYNRTFLDIVRRYGRMFEMELMIRFGPVDPFGLISQAPAGLKMLNKGRLAFSPCRIEGKNELANIFEHYGEGGSE